MAALRFGKVGLAAIIDTREERIFRRSWRIARSMNVRGGTLPQSTANGGVCQWFSGPVGVRDAHAALRIRQSWHAESGAADAKLQPGHLELVTDDADGDVVASAPTENLTEEAVRSQLAEFVGEIDQVPSSVSAIKVGGKRAYALVRSGEQVDLPARRVTIHGLDVTGLALPDVRVSVHCSSGTYVRAIARDLGAALGVGGHLTALRRTAVGPFTLDHARTLDELAEHFTMSPVAEAARTCFPSRDLDEAEAADVRVGRRLDLQLDGVTALFGPHDEFLALYQEGDDGRAKAVAVFG